MTNFVPAVAVKHKYAIKFHFNIIDVINLGIKFTQFGRFMKTPTSMFCPHDFCSG